jgi:hypothetical protein
MDLAPNSTKIDGMPQGVLCEALFRTHSWSWVEITHLCNPLHNIPVRFVFFRYIPSPPSRTRPRLPLCPSASVLAAAASWSSAGRPDRRGTSEMIQPPPLPLLPSVFASSWSSSSGTPAPPLGLRPIHCSVAPAWPAPAAPPPCPAGPAAAVVRPVSAFGCIHAVVRTLGATCNRPPSFGTGAVQRSRAAARCCWVVGLRLRRMGALSVRRRNEEVGDAIPMAHCPVRPMFKCIQSSVIQFAQSSNVKT